MKVHVKWNKELFKDVEVDMDQPPIVFKMQLMSLTGVPVNMQKVMGKGGMLKDDEWGKVTLKEGMTVMMLGTAEKPPEVAKAAPAPKFIEDLPEQEQEIAETRQYGAGIPNLGNTCYVNSCLQCIYKVPELTSSLANGSGGQDDPFTRTSGQLMAQMARGGPVDPTLFIIVLRQTFPQFDQLGDAKVPGVPRQHAQQDAEECWTAVRFLSKKYTIDKENPS